MNQQFAIAVKCIPQHSGFWLELMTNRTIKYKMRYFVLGAAGYQRQGELEGSASAKHTRRFIELGFSGKKSIARQEPVDDFMRFGTPPAFPTARLKGGGRIEVSAAARKRRNRSSEGTYHGMYGGYGSMYGAYGIYLHGGVGARTPKSRKNTASKQKPSRPRQPGRKRKK
jgi:hypothetical protein